MKVPCKSNLLLTLVLITACSTSPLGRKQLMLLPDGQMNSMGAQAFTQIKQQTPEDTDPRWTTYVKCVATPITEGAKGQLQVPSWEIVVFKSDQVNAFALPGGKIGVYTGLLAVAKNDAQLAAVIGHEVGHVIARHGNERMSEGLIAQGVAITTELLTQGSPKQGLAMGLLGVGTQFGYTLPHSRTQESEADLIGLDLSARSGFDPRQAVDLWHNMGAASGKGPPEFLSTHPANETRIKAIQDHLPDAVAKYDASVKHVCARP